MPLHLIRGATYFKSCKKPVRILCANVGGGSRRMPELCCIALEVTAHNPIRNCCHRLDLWCSSPDRRRTLAMDQKEHASKMSHGAAITLRLCQICGITGSRRVVCGDSFFSSLDTALQLSAHGLQFSGIVKTAHAGYPKSFFKDWCVALLFFSTPIQINKPHISPFKQVCTWFWNSVRENSTNWR